VGVGADVDGVVPERRAAAGGRRIYDADGSITDDVFGEGANNSLLGFAGPDCSNQSGTITEGTAVLNGRFLDGVNTASNRELTLASFNAVFIHEFGHYIDLDHSQMNLTEGRDGVSANDAAIATMFPFLANGAQQSSLNADDEVSVSMLYPEPSFASATGKLTGTITRSDGAPFQGAYVIARNVGNPRLVAVGVTSGARYRTGRSSRSIRRSRAARASVPSTRRRRCPDRPSSGTAPARTARTRTIRRNRP
jgi:hypothetical protein